MQLSPEKFRQTVEAAQVYAAGEVSTDTVLKGISDGNYQSWLVDGLHIITCVVPYESFTRLRITHAHGNLQQDTVVKALSIMENFATVVGCKSVEIYGRGGWAKKLREYGYRQQYVVLIKELGEGHE